MAEQLSAFQALVTGAVIGSLMRAEAFDPMLEIEPVIRDGNYTNEIRVRGRESGERLLIVVKEVNENWWNFGW